VDVSQFAAGAVIALVTLWLAYLAYVYRASRAAIGRSVGDLADRFPGIDANDRPALLYFYSEHCPPCRQTTPDVDALAAERSSVFKVDVTQAPDLARHLGVRVTPTFLVIRDGRVTRVLLGAKPRSTLERAIDSP
jgi:thioredoxin 1